MEIKTIPKFSLQNLEHFLFASYIYMMCKDANIAKLTPLLTPLLAAVNTEDTALNQP